MQVEDYFRLKDGFYESTDYFSCLAYNDFSNLWVLCHCCNLDKHDKDSLEWLYSQNMFGDAFKQYVEAQGGYKVGLFVGQISVAEGNKAVIVIDTQDGPEESTIYSSGQGIGEFAHHWFMSQRNEAVGSAHKIFKFKLTVYEILQTLFDMKKEGRIEEAKRGFQSPMRTMMMKRFMMRQQMWDRAQSVSEVLRSTSMFHRRKVCVK